MNSNLSGNPQERIQTTYSETPPRPTSNPNNILQTILLISIQLYSDSIKMTSQGCSFHWGKDGVDQKKRHQNDGPNQGERGAGPEHEIRPLGSLDRIDLLGQGVIRPPRVPAHVLVRREFGEEPLLPPLPEVGPGLVPIGGRVLT